MTPPSAPRPDGQEAVELDPTPASTERAPTAGAALARAEPAPAEPEPRRPVRRGGGAPGISKPVRPAPPSGLAPELFGGIRVRSPEVVGAELGLGLRLSSAFLVVRFQPETSWNAEGRPVALSAFGVELGWLHPLSLGEDTRVFGRVAALGERIELRQVDIDRGARHEALDLGAVLGLLVDRRLAGGLWAALGVEGIWAPTAGDVVIEDARPSSEWDRVPFNGVGGRATLAFSWRR